MKQVIRPGLISGTIAIPASKSDAQRAILCAALAEGTSRLTGIGKSDDELAMLEAARMRMRMRNRMSILLQQLILLLSLE